MQHPLSVCDSLRRSIDGDDRAVLPEAFQAVEGSLLLVEHVDDQITEVQQYPPRLLAPLAAQTLVSCLQQLLFDLVGDRRDIAFAATGREQKDIDERV